MKSIIVFISSVFLVLPAFSQRLYDVEVGVKPIKRTGFYKIFLPPTITGKTKASLGDMRLLDNKGNEVPYYLYCEDIKKYEPVFEEFTIKNQTDTSLILEKKNLSPFKEFVLRVKNQDITKQFRIQGSDNLNDWKTFAREFKWNPARSQKIGDKDTVQEKVINLGKNNFKYFRITYLDSLRQNFDFVSLGSNHRSILEKAYTKIKEPLFEQYFDKEKKITTFYISFYQKHFLDRLEFEFNERNKNHKNKAKLYQVYEENGEQKEKFLNTFELKLGEDNTLTFDRLFVKKLVLRVEHNEKEPLILKDIHAYELNKYMVAYLYRNQEYQFRLGNDTVKKATYSEEELYKKEGVLSMPITELKKMKKPLKEWRKKEIQFFESISWIWGGFFILFVLLTLFLIRLIIDYRKKKDVANNT
ncbi:MAG: hypothetical protein GY827_08575 [Cytophagales bacterium]|nr:hypothetical protein [Cytophagales bacterium]